MLILLHVRKCAGFKLNIFMCVCAREIGFSLAQTYIHNFFFRLSLLASLKSPRITFASYFRIQCLNTFNHPAFFSSSSSSVPFDFSFIRSRVVCSLRFAFVSLYFYHFFNFFVDFGSSFFFVHFVFFFHSLWISFLCLTLAHFWINKFEYLHRVFSQTFRFGNFLFFVHFPFLFPIFDNM